MLFGSGTYMHLPDSCFTSGLRREGNGIHSLTHHSIVYSIYDYIYWALFSYTDCPVNIFFQIRENDFVVSYLGMCLFTGVVSLM